MSAAGRRTAVLPAGEARTGFVIAAALTLLAQFGIARGGGALALALHAVCAGLAYLLFVNLTKRKLGAPLIAAALFGAHPALVPLLTAPDGAPAVAGTALALLAAILLARTPLDRRLLWPALGVHAMSLPFAPAGAALPLLVAAAVVAYHGLEPARLLTKRIAPRFLAFLVPLAAWIVYARLADAAPRAAPGSIPTAAASVIAPFASWPATGAVAGACLALALVGLGLAFLRRGPKWAWPLAAAGACLLAGAFVPGATGAPGAAALPAAFLLLLAAEGVEELFYRFGAVVAMPLAMLLYAALAAQSHLAAAAR